MGEQGREGGEREAGGRAREQEREGKRRRGEQKRRQRGQEKQIQGSKKGGEWRGMNTREGFKMWSEEARQSVCLSGIHR